VFVGVVGLFSSFSEEFSDGFNLVANDKKLSSSLGDKFGLSGLSLILSKALCRGSVESPIGESNKSEANALAVGLEFNFPLLLTAFLIVLMAFLIKNKKGKIKI